MKHLRLSVRLTSLLLLGLCASDFVWGQPLKPINLIKLNTKADEVDPYLSRDGRQLFYASNPKGHFNLMVARRAKLTQAFPIGKEIKELNGDDKADRRSPFLTRDGRFYFASNTLPRDAEKEAKRNFDFSFTRKISARDPFMQATPLLGISTEEDEMHPWVTVSGKEFYFSRRSKEGWRVFVAKGPALGAITDPKPVDFPAGFHHPTMTRTGLTMYLQGPLEKNRWGLFRATRKSVKSAWSKPLELINLNSQDAPRGDMFPSLSADGTKLYFSSDRPGGKGGLDIYCIGVSQLKTTAK